MNTPPVNDPYTCPGCGAATDDDGTGNALCPDCAEAEADRQGLTDFEAGYSGRNYRWFGHYQPGQRPPAQARMQGDCPCARA